MNFRAVMGLTSYSGFPSSALKHEPERTCFREAFFFNGGGVFMRSAFVSSPSLLSPTARRIVSGPSPKRQLLEIRWWIMTAARLHSVRIAGA